MNATLRGLFVPRDSLTRRGFFAWGVILFACKYALDLALTYYGFGQAWWPTDYLFRRAGRIELRFNSSIGPSIAMVAIALPFIWMGVTLTLRRLLTLRWPAWLACLFFFP